MTIPGATRVGLVLLSTVVGVGLLAGCGPSVPTGAAGAAASGVVAPGPTAGGGGALDACGLINEQDATTAVGAPSGPGVPGGTADAPQCVYGNGVLIIDVTRTDRADYDSQRSAMTSGPAGSAHDVTGIGDGAFEVNGGPTAIVMFYQSGTLVEIILQGNLAAPADAAIAVARAAAAHD